MAPPNAPKVDLTIVFRAGSKSLSKQEARDNALAAEAEYAQLITALKDGGLKATGRRGEKSGQLLVLIWAPSPKLMALVQRERYVGFLIATLTPTRALAQKNGDAVLVTELTVCIFHQAFRFPAWSPDI